MKNFFAYRQPITNVPIVGCFAIRKHTSLERFRYILSCKKKSLPFFKEEDIKIYEDAGFNFPKPDLMKFYIEE